MLKRGKLIKLFGVLFLILFLLPLVKSEALCLTKAGDANGDSNVDISDAVTILKYLFQGGSELCRNNADADANGILAITDAIRILKFLFAGGPPPQSIDQPLVLGYINYGADVNKLETTEPLLVTVPGKIEILDTAFEDPPVFNIKKCEAYKKENGEDMLFYSSSWEDNDKVDIKHHPLTIFIEPSDFVPEEEYNIRVKCWEQDGDSGEVALRIRTKPQIVFNFENYPRVECSTNDRCCVRQDQSYYCIVDIGRGAPPCDSGDIAVSQDECCHPYPAGPEGCLIPQDQIRQLVNSQSQEPQKNRYTLLDNPETPAHQCKVEKMTIITKGGSLVFGGVNNDEPPLPIPEPIGGTPSLNGNGLGHSEGWVDVYSTISHKPKYWVRFGFYVFAWLAKGSQPDKCAEHQFFKLTTISNDIASSKNSAPWMYDHNKLVSILSLYDIPLVDEDSIFKLTMRRIQEKEGCSFQGNRLCDDNYGRPLDEKIHLSGTPFMKPVIYWFDGPGYLAPQHDVQGATSERPWEDKTGVISTWRSRDDHYVMIIEGTNKIRWVCELELHFENLGDKATSTKKFDIQEKFCECRKQERSGEFWVDTDTNPCNTT